MSQLLDTLHHEHQTILKAAGALRAFAERHARKGPEPRKILGYFVLFFRQYLDQMHHGKEETLLFPAMVDAGVPENVGPMGCMMREHDDCRAQLDAMAAMASGVGDLTEREGLVLIEMATSFVRLLDHHIGVEDQTLYPTAQRVLSSEQFGALDELAGKFKGAWGQTGLDLQDLGDTLASRYGGAPETHA